MTSHLGKIDFKKTPEEIDAMKKKGDLSIIVPELKAQLEKAVGHEVKVTFCPATRGEELANAVKGLNNGEIVLMQTPVMKRVRPRTILSLQKNGLLWLMHMSTMLSAPTTESMSPLMEYLNFSEVKESLLE